MRIMLKSKIQTHITDLNLHYTGSISIDKDLMEKANIIPYEQVHIINTNTGGRLITYAIGGKGGEVCLNGGAARMGEVGDEIIILAYTDTPNDGGAYFIGPPLIVSG